MNDLHKILIVGAGMGLGDRLAALLPSAAPEKVITESDREALAAAEAKRRRRAERNKSLGARP